MIRIIHMENMAMITEAGITNNERAISFRMKIDKRL